MIHCAYYDSTGRVHQTMGVPDDVTPPELPGLTRIELADRFAAKDIYVKNGEVRSIPPEASEHKVFDLISESWIDPRTVGDLRDAKWGLVKQARDAAEYGGFVWDGSTFDSDMVSQSRIQGAAQLATLAQIGGQPFSINWTLADNTVRTLSAADMIGVGNALGMHINTQHGKGRLLRTQLDAAVTLAEIEAINW